MGENENENEYVLKMENISKSYPGVTALDGASLNLKYGEVLALCGENGAGKSTLMQVLAGIIPPDAGSGEILYQGKPVRFKNPNEAKKAGIVMVFQELSLVKDLSVAENIFLGSLPRKGGHVDWKTLNQTTQQVLDELGSPIRAQSVVSSLPIAHQQMVEIARGIALGAKVLILDEPTSSLTDKEKNSLFKVIRNLKAKGIGIIYITHKMDEIFEISDRVLVLRDGRPTGDFVTSQVGLDDIIKSMIGRTLGNYFPRCQAQPGKEVLRVENLTLGGVYRDVSFSVHEREVVGFYGLVGAGRTEIMETLFGIRKPDSGEVYIDGKKSRIRSSFDALKNSIGFVTENRRVQGLVLEKSCRENISLAMLPWLQKFGFVDDKRALSLYDEYHEKLRISSPGPEQPVKFLSGGNQQKVVIGKWLALRPKLLILDEPTRGIDVGSKAEIHKLIAQLAENGIAVIVISSEMPEIMGISNRIYTIAQGRITGEFSGVEITEENLMKSIVITDSRKEA